MDNTTLENNRVVAVFMGAIAQQWYPESKVYNQTGIHFEYPLGGIYPDNQRHHADQLLKYHKSFDWLIPAWHKFHELVLEQVFTKNNYNLLSKFDLIVLDFNAFIAENNCQKAFNKLVEGLKWYNELHNNK